MNRILTFLMAYLMVVCPVAPMALAATYSVIPDITGRDAVIIPGRHPDAHIQTTSADRALAATLAMGTTGRITFAGAGQYNFDSGVTIAYDGVHIDLQRGATLVPGSGDVGLFKFTGDQCSLTGGGKVLISTAVNDQEIIEFENSSFSEVSDIHFEMSAEGSSANPITLVLADTCIDFTFERNVILPNAGLRVLHVYEGHGGEVHYNRIRNDSDHGIAGTGELPTTDTAYRKMWRGFDFEGAQWFNCTNNMFWDIGAEDGDEVDVFITYNRLKTPAPSSEEGHFKILANTIEACVPDDHYISVYGGNLFQISDNFLSWAKGAPATLGDAAIYVSSRRIGTTEQTGAGEQSVNWMINDNQIHNYAAAHTDPIDGTDDSLAVGIYIARANRGSIKGNHFTFMDGAYTMIIDSNQCTQVQVTDNYSDAVNSGGQFLVGFVGTTGGDYYFGNNHAEAMADGIIAGGLTGTNINYGGIGYNLKTAATTVAITAPITVSSGDWTDSTKTLTFAATPFASYTHTAGDQVYLSAGTGVTVGRYTIASKTDNTLVLTADINGASGDISDTSIAARIDSKVTDTGSGLTHARPGHFAYLSGASNAANNRIVRINSASANGAAMMVDFTMTAEAAGSAITIYLLDTNYKS